MSHEFHLKKISAFRVSRSGLIRPWRTAEETAAGLVGVQAQILSAAAISIFNRTQDGPATYAEFERLLFRERQLVKLWAQRGTLHLYPSRQWPLVQGALSTRKTWWVRQIEKNGGDLRAYRKLVSELEKVLRKKGTLGRSDLRALRGKLPIEEDHLSSWGGIFGELVYAGYACHAESFEGEGRFAHREHWIPSLAWNPPSSDEANRELFERFLAAYGPATLADFIYWRGCRAGDARRWLRDLGDRVIEIDEEKRLLLAADRDAFETLSPPQEDEAWPVRLLYRFDPLLLAHRDKSWIVPEEKYKQVWRPAGHIEGILLSSKKGRAHALATWRYDRIGDELKVTVRPFRKNLPAFVRKSVQIEARRISGFLEAELGDLVWEFKS